MSIVIRQSVPEDILQIYELESECFVSGRNIVQITDDFSSNFRYTAVAADNGAVIGYAALEIILDEAYIMFIAVSPSRRREHIGKMLLEHLDSIAAARGLSFISLEVRESNVSAINLYSSCEYKKSGLMKNYYSNPKENALILTKHFQEVLS